MARKYSPVLSSSHSTQAAKRGVMRVYCYNLHHRLNLGNLLTITCGQGLGVLYRLMVDLLFGITTIVNGLLNTPGNFISLNPQFDPVIGNALAGVIEDDEIELTPHSRHAATEHRMQHGVDPVFSHKSRKKALRILPGGDPAPQLIRSLGKQLAQLEPESEEAQKIQDKMTTLGRLKPEYKVITDALIKDVQCKQLRDMANALQTILCNLDPDSPAALAVQARLDVIEDLILEIREDK